MRELTRKSTEEFRKSLLPCLLIFGVPPPPFFFISLGKYWLLARTVPFSTAGVGRKRGKKGGRHARFVSVNHSQAINQYTKCDIKKRGGGQGETRKEKESDLHTCSVCARRTDSPVVNDRLKDFVQNLLFPFTDISLGLRNLSQTAHHIKRVKRKEWKKIDGLVGLSWCSPHDSLLHHFNHNFSQYFLVMKWRNCNLYT